LRSTPSSPSKARWLIASTLALGAAACTSEPPAVVERGELAVDVAALNLDGVAEAIWDVEVRNGADDIVWQRRLTSSAYGDGAGSASYVGTCDAASGVDENTVRVWVVGIYGAAVASGDSGAFASGSTTGVGAVSATPLPLSNPTAGGPMERDVICVPDQDVAVAFDVTLTRPASQGFFDVAMSFNDVFCSAKLDCCDDATGDGCTSDEDIALLFDDTGARSRTIVLGLACTAGTDAGVDTRLYMDPLELDCSSPNAGVDFSADLALAVGDPEAGNRCLAGDMAGCDAVTDVTGAVDPDSVLFQLATFRGDEPLTSAGVAAHKVYWNVALGVRAGISACRLRTRASADDAASADDSFVDGIIAPGAVYPYIRWDADLGSCGSEALTFDDAGAPVTAAYTTTAEASPEFTYFFGPSIGAGPVCNAVTELCDDLDNDCDGAVDEGCDDDGDGYCDANLGYVGSPAICPNGGGDADDDLISYGAWGDTTLELTAGTYTISAWGAAGGPGRINSSWSNGGGGGFARGTWVHTGGNVIVRVGQGGAEGDSSAHTAFGGGGYGGTSDNSYYGGGGGGLSGVFLPVGGALGSGSLQSRAVLIAGGGGGAAYTRGAGGGTNGQKASDSGNSGGGYGGTQSAGGAGGHRGASYGSAGQAGSALQGGRGGTGNRSGGGGGGGYFGGGGGGSNNYLGAGGGGGSGFVHPSLTNKTLTAGSGTSPANASDPNRGNAGSPSTTRVVSGLRRGWDGLVIITRVGD